MYPHDPIEDFVVITGSSARGFKLKNGDYIYYFITLEHMEDALDKLDRYNNEPIPLIHNAWFVLKNDSTIIKNRLVVEEMVDMCLPILIEQDRRLLTETEQNA